MREVMFMEHLLTIEAEVKYLLTARDRTLQRTLKERLLRIIADAEFWFGPRASSYELREPLITECFTANVMVYPFGFARIYLSRLSGLDRRMAAYELAHEAVHVYCPAYLVRPTILEEGLASWFSLRHVNRVYGLGWDRTGDPRYDDALSAVSNLLAKNEFVIKALRARQPVISRIDERLLVEVAGIEPGEAKFLCTDFESYRPSEPTNAKS